MVKCLCPVNFSASVSDIPCSKGPFARIPDFFANLQQNTDQPAHLRSQISTFVGRILEDMIAKRTT